MSGRRPTPADARFAEKCVPRDSGCIEWTGGTTMNGYGLFYADGQMRPAHRWAYERMYGPLAPNLDCCHHCDNKACVNVEHLFSGTRRENMQDAVRKGRTSRGRPRPSMQGSNHHHAVLRDIEVMFIRKLHEEGVQMRALSDEFGVSFQSISRIVRRISWSHIA